VTKRVVVSKRKFKKWEQELDDVMSVFLAAARGAGLSHGQVQLCQTNLRYIFANSQTLAHNENARKWMTEFSHVNGYATASSIHELLNRLRAVCRECGLNY